MSTTTRTYRPRPEARPTGFGVANPGARLRPHLWCCVSLFLAAPLLCARAADGDGGDPVRAVASGFELRVAAGGHSVSVISRDASVEDILHEISRQNGLVVRITGKVSDPITLEFHRLPLGEALRRVLTNHNFLLDHTPSGNRSGVDGRPPGRLWVFARDHSDTPDGGPPSSPDGVGPSRSAGRPPEAGTTESLLRTLSEGDVTERRQAMYPLIRTGSDVAIAAVTDALTDEHAEVRMEAAYALGEAGVKSAVWKLAQSLNDAERFVRIAAVEALADIGGDEAVNALSIALQNSDATVHEAAAEALAMLVESM